ncbi:TPA: DUF4148 domain-containing protein [Burkholderia contaminans]|uniref:DUF4148 domain-containing protein n=1 Tax=Burkholderia cepacia complex TaxID=87882 RepID=UPI0009C1116F|nr:MULTISPECIES: DUF4148 domain-containing protein [Burkholderia cepacia complex]MBM6430575.1 DUF4148 domain-containing protein [Burkholderia contaminans]MCA7880842.1 DUF4148 domain-containing protein [Burkholderia contaminans]MCB4349254.1 DUF4148 domain-containing protein [Burkholderia vietnamiensis]MDN8025834.1 DUF4148 domain-containing protein [Burkholderia contaminans]PRG04178.1 DUF4148 domain-containing protein [Burkholderia contaminans]
MNVRIVAAIIVAATTATSAFADGGHDYPNVGTSSGTTSSHDIALSASTVSQSGSDAPNGKTREQVRQELIRAYHDGVLPISKRDYPPSPQAIARNKELHNLVEPKWAAQH